ncbi:gamma-glutamyl hydrolase 2-like isoform X2 [Citrus sinensis]|uniref:gamma-glutamyl hydrolase 2 isoform X2 n=1 Tax=Citrus clementina TaxID=85681 RepID=UPI000CED724B|nr:gamma-glutamyl hydrolase 2 isoform X2 [Citrus x clementina]XP_024954193.2 gamma-glutamyl hydrolase 2-like isoform X2 [Citrus sinensis]
MWGYLWIPILFSLSKEFSSVEAQSKILLPSQRQQQQNDAVSSLSVLGPRCPVPDSKLNYRPVIGIVTHPGDGASGRLNNATNASYIAASYVKFVESAGARVIPLIYNEPEDVLFEKLELVNGVLYTGGWAKDGLYYEIVEKVFKKILEKNDAGDHFPLYAHCLGFELLTMIIGKDKNILESFNAADQASTLQFIENTSIEGTVFQRFPPQLIKKLSTDCLVMQNHHYGISPETLRKNLDLSRFFKMLTTSADEDNKKNAFEWGSSAIPHSEDAIEVTQHVANYFISEARRSVNRPPAQKVLDNLIYNYRPTFCGKAGKGFDEVYIFTQHQP